MLTEQKSTWLLHNAWKAQTGKSRKRCASHSLRKYSGTNCQTRQQNTLLPAAQCSSCSKMFCLNRCRLLKNVVIETRAKVVFVATDRFPLIEEIETHLKAQKVSCTNLHTHLFPDQCRLGFAWCWTNVRTELKEFELQPNASFQFLRPHAHQTQPEKRSTLGDTSYCSNMSVHTAGNEQLMMQQEQNGTWLHFFTSHRVSRPVCMGPQGTTICNF